MNPLHFHTCESFGEADKRRRELERVGYRVEIREKYLTMKGKPYYGSGIPNNAVYRWEVWCTPNPVKYLIIKPKEAPTEAELEEIEKEGV